MASTDAPKLSDSHLVLNDGVRIAYTVAGNGPDVVLLHGWSGSRHYYREAMKALSDKCRVYALDLRFHGDSDKPSWGHHVARLAMDLHEFIGKLRLKEPTVVGSSMGASIIWCYFELFGSEAGIARAVMVDQTPLQNRAADWALGSSGCYDAASLARLQTTLNNDFEAIAYGNLKDCLQQKVGPEVEALLVAETLKADPAALGKLMADHTQLDWRPLLPRIRVPCLNLIGRRSGVFPWEGCAYVGRAIPGCQTVTFEDCSHWLYIEEPRAFATIVLTFVTGGMASLEKASNVKMKVGL